MRDRLVALGWSQIETVDDDLGRSAAGGITRAGFDRMVTEVCLGKVGAVAAREVSRFARNSRDWQQLMEMCRVVDTVLIHQEIVYAPQQPRRELAGLLWAFAWHGRGAGPARCRLVSGYLLFVLPQDAFSRVREYLSCASWSFTSLTARSATPSARRSTSTRLRSSAILS